jgi:hypothetical protein
MSDLEPLIKTQEELYEHFMHCTRPSMPDRIKKQAYAGVNVTSKIRRDVMTNARQGKITIGGIVMKIGFRNLGGGGVYLAKVETLS